MGFGFGALAGGLTLMSGGSILLALAAYSGVGAVGALAVTFLVVFFGNSSSEAGKWQDKSEHGTVSA